MSIAKLTDQLYLAAQLSEADAKQAGELGIQTVICNRPDGEEASQPDVAEVKHWLEAQDIKHFQHQPVIAANISAADVAAFNELIKQAAPPVLAYCRTGTRSALLWAFHQVQNGMSVAEAVATVAQAGVNLNAFEARLHDAAQNGLA